MPLGPNVWTGRCSDVGLIRELPPSFRPRSMLRFGMDLASCTVLVEHVA